MMMLRYYFYNFAQSLQMWRKQRKAARDIVRMLRASGAKQIAPGRWDL
jgi:hypothetical protein